MFDEQQFRTQLNRNVRSLLAEGFDTVFAKLEQAKSDALFIPDLPADERKFVLNFFFQLRQKLETEIQGTHERNFQNGVMGRTNNFLHALFEKSGTKRSA